MSRRRHQKGTVQKRGDSFRGIYRKSPEAKTVPVPLGKASEGMTKRQAERKLQEIIKKMEDEAPRLILQPGGSSGGITVKQYIEEHYMKEIWPNLKPSTRKGYKQVIDSRIIPALGDKEFREVTRSDIQLFITRVQPMRKLKRLKRRLAYNTVKNVRNALGSIFADAEVNKAIRETPVHKILMPPKDPRRKIAIPEPDVVQRVVDSLHEPYCTLIWFVAVMGCRIGEAFGLKWGSIDFIGKKIWFLEARYMGKEVHLTKGHCSEKPVYLSDYEVERLRAYKATCEPQGDDDLVFLDNGQPMTGDHALQQELQKAAEMHGLHLTFHGLRHWAGTMLARAGAPLKDIQVRMGHAHLQTTMIYIEEHDEGQQNAAEIASQFMRPVVAFSPGIATNTATKPGLENVSA